MLYKSTAPYAQLSYDLGPITFSGGVRHEDGKLTVNSYTTTYYRNRVFVQGGSLKYTENLPNVGAIWRIDTNGRYSLRTARASLCPTSAFRCATSTCPGRPSAGILDLRRDHRTKQGGRLQLARRARSFGGPTTTRSRSSACRWRSIRRPTTSSCAGPGADQGSEATGESCRREMEGDRPVFAHPRQDRVW